jgi:hypothetical protein
MTAVLTERQKKWFATVQANLEKNTGKPLAHWVAIMKTCPETAPRAQAAWLKTEHGVGHGWDDPEALRAALWKDPTSLAILEAVERVADGVEGVISGQRKGYTSFSRAVQFAAMRPLKGGRALLGLKLAPETSPRLSPSARRESWSERLTATVELDVVDQVDAELGRLFAQAADNG